MGKCPKCDGSGEVWLDEDTIEECNECCGEGNSVLINKDEETLRDLSKSSAD